MNDPGYQPQTSKRGWSYLAGIICANVAGVLTMLFVTYAYSLSDSKSMIGVSFLASQFIAIPMGMGIVASFFWRKLELIQSKTLSGVFFVSLLCIVSSYTVLREGVICLVMASPLLYAFIWLGTVLGTVLWKRNPWLGVSTLPLLALMLVVDASLPHHHEAIVRDEILIRATPQQVWHYVPDYSPITAPPDYWLWKIGLPVPVQSTSQGAFVGSRRDCRFSGDVVFEEKIVEVKPAQILTFDVIKQPDHPEVTGHFNLDRGRFELRDNGDGTTALIGTTWYRLHVYPSQYFDLWAADIIRKVHLRVMNHIKALAESDAKRDTVRHAKRMLADKTR